MFQLVIHTLSSIFSMQFQLQEKVLQKIQQWNLKLNLEEMEHGHYLIAIQV